MQKKIIAAALSLSALLFAGPSLAAGTVTGVALDKTVINLGQSLNATVNGTLNLDQFKKGCQVKISLKYADNTVEEAHPGFLVNAFPSTGFYLKPSKSGKVHVIAVGGGTNSLGWPACQGSAQADLTVNMLVVADPVLIKGIKPEAGGTTAQTIDVRQVPTVALQMPTLKSIKQVQYTDHSGETWIEANGTGNCTFTVEGAGLPAQSFATNAAKPFPIKIKIAGAPLGSHQWKAKGTGNCTGEASATFSVD